MKIAVSTQGKDLQDQIDTRFGRAAGFIIYDLDTDEYEYISNSENAYAMQGAGPQTAQVIAQAGAEAVITGHIGPKAYSALNAGKIKIFLAQENKTVQETIQNFKQGNIKSSDGADKPGHW